MSWHLAEFPESIDVCVGVHLTLQLDAQNMPRVAAPIATVRAEVVEMCLTMALCH